MAYKKAKKDRKEEVIRLRVTAEQKTRMTEAARKLGLEISAWLRTMGVQEANRIHREETNRLPQVAELGQRIVERGRARRRSVNTAAS